MKKTLPGTLLAFFMLAIAPAALAAAPTITDGLDTASKKFVLKIKNTMTRAIEVRFEYSEVRNLTLPAGNPQVITIAAQGQSQISMGIPDATVQSYVTWRAKYRPQGSTAWVGAGAHTFGGTLSAIPVPTVTDKFDTTGSNWFWVRVKNIAAGPLQIRVTADAATMRNVGFKFAELHDYTLAPGRENGTPFAVKDARQPIYITWHAFWRQPGATDWRPITGHTFGGTLKPGTPVIDRSRDRYFADGVYMIPFGRNARYNMASGPNGYGWHQGRNAYDWVMPVGTAIFAARGGTVHSCKSDSNRGGATQNFMNDANFVIIDHGDGTLSEYGHLKQNSVLVRKGQPVAIGDQLALSGNTGWTTQPHLHFHVIDRAGTTYRLNFLTKNGVISPESGTMMTGYFPWMP